MPFTNKFTKMIFLLFIIGFGNELFAIGASKVAARIPVGKTSEEVTQQIDLITKSNKIIEDKITEVEGQYNEIDKLPICLTTTFDYCAGKDEQKIQDYLNKNPSLVRDSLMSTLKNLREFKNKLNLNKTKLKELSGNLDNLQNSESLSRAHNTEQEVRKSSDLVQIALTDISELKERVNSLTSNLQNVANYVTGSQLKEALREVINSKDMCQRIQFCIDKSTKDSKPMEQKTIDDIFKKHNIKTDSSVNQSSSGGST